MKRFIIAGLCLSAMPACVSYAAPVSTAAPRVLAKKPLASYPARFAQEHDRWRAAYVLVVRQEQSVRTLWRDFNSGVAYNGDVSPAVWQDIKFQAFEEMKKQHGLTDTQRQKNIDALWKSNARLANMAPVPKKYLAVQKMVKEGSELSGKGLFFIGGRDGLPLLQRAANRLQTARARLPK